MGRKRTRICLILAAPMLLAGMNCEAQEHGLELGYLSSLKRMGVSVSTPRKGKSVRDRFVAALDMTGTWKGGEERPGWELAYSCLHSYRNQALEKCAVAFYAGPGFSFGMKKDFESERGAVFAVNGECGVRFEFADPGVVLQLSFSGELGVHRSKGQIYNNLSFFKKGITGIFMPELTVLFRL